MSDGKTNWLEGIMLTAAYFLIASAFYFMKDDVEAHDAAPLTAPPSPPA